MRVVFNFLTKFHEIVFLNYYIDVSIWLHQAIKGFQDSKGEAIPNAHLLSIYHRVCKLLYYKIRPIFVFDGGVPALKKRVIVSFQFNLVLASIFMKFSQKAAFRTNLKNFSRQSF